MLKVKTLLTSDTVRIPGQSPSELSYNIASLAWPSSQIFWRPGAIILVPDNRWRQAVAAVPLIHLPRNAPLIASDSEELGSKTERIIRRLQPTGKSPDGKPLAAQIFVVGSFKTQVSQSLIRKGWRVVTINTPNIFELAAKIARIAVADMPNPNLTLIPAESYLDSQAVVGLAAHMAAPILFIEATKLPIATEKAITDIKPKAIYIVGRDSSVSLGVVDKVKALVPGVKVERIGGKTAPDLSINLASYMDMDTMYGWGRTEPRGDVFSFVPTNNSYAGVCAGMLSHIATHAPILSVPENKPLPKELEDYLIRLNPPMPKPPGPPFMRGWIIGDTNGISSRQQLAIESLLIKELGDWPPEH